MAMLGRRLSPRSVGRSYPGNHLEQRLPNPTSFQQRQALIAAVVKTNINAFVENECTQMTTSERVRMQIPVRVSQRVVRQSPVESRA